MTHSSPAGTRKTYNIAVPHVDIVIMCILAYGSAM